MNTTNIKFLQTGGVPLTNDLMDTLQSAYEIFNATASLAGQHAILYGCDTVGNTVSDGIVAINGKLYHFLGGTVSTTVFIHKEEIDKTFQDATDKVLIEKHRIRFGAAAPGDTFNWSDFVKIKTVKEISLIIENMATQQQISDLQMEVNLLKQKTAPIINGGIVWAWFKPASEIPTGWKECTDIRGRTIVGLNPSDPQMDTLKQTLGAKTHHLTINELPAHSHAFPTTRDFGDSTPSSQVTTDPQAFKGMGATQETGGNQPHNNMQPSIIAYFIEPNF